MTTPRDPELPPQESPAEHLSARIGRRVHEVRESGGTTLATLAQRSGVGRSTLSGVERGNRRPTLDTLARVSDALGVPIQTLLVEGQPASLTDLDVLATGARVDDLGRWDAPGARVEVFRLRITQGRRRLPPGRPGARGYLTVVAGSVLAGSPATPRTLQTGHQLAFATDQPHVVEAVDGPAECVLVVRHPLPEQAGESAESAKSAESAPH